MDPQQEYKLRSEAKMQAFDRLPLTVRRVLTNSQFNWNVEELLAMHRRKQMTAWELCRYIEREDRERLENRDC